MAGQEKIRKRAMAKLKTIYEKVEEIPEGYAELYVERNGKYELTGIEGVKTQADIDRVQGGLVNEKKEHKATKEKLAKFGDLDPEVVPAQLSELEATKAQLATAITDGKIDPEKNAAAIDAAVKRALGPVEREKTQLQRDLDAARKAGEMKTAEVLALEGSIKQTKMEGTLRDAALDGKVLPTAIDDAVMVGSRMFELAEDGRMLTKDNVGVTPGLDAKEWLKDMKEKRPHWWPLSQGGGARGGGGGPTSRADNPFTQEGWNVSRQGQAIKTLGLAKAAEMAKAAGVEIGATKPAAKAA
jgi:hypothetical protein